MGRARIIHRTYDYEPNDTTVLNWDDAPDAPDDFETTTILDWNDKELWDKSYGGRVLAPAVRDALFERCGIFATFWTPLFLEEWGFRKLCYLVVSSNEDLETFFQDDKHDWSSVYTTELPANYLPFDYRDEPLEWAWLQYQQREQNKRISFMQDAAEEYYYFDDEASAVAEHESESECRTNQEFQEDELFVDADGWLVKSNDQVRLVNYTETELNGAIGTVYFHDPQSHRRNHVNVFMPSISEDTAISISIHNLRKFILSGSDYSFRLLGSMGEPLVDWSEMPPERDDSDDENWINLADLSNDVKNHIASFLTLVEVERNLRHACRDTFWNFRKPPPDDLEYYDFIYFYGSNDETGEWHGVAHTTRDVLRALKEHDWQCPDDRFLSFNLMFIKFDRSQPIVPLFKYENFREADEHLPAEWDPIGLYYCGVEQASHIALESSFVSIHELNDPKQTENQDLICILRHCDDWTPREPRIPLCHFGSRKADCEQCGGGDSFCRCEVAQPGGTRGRDIRIYYSPEWYDTENHSFCYSWPSGSSEKSVVLFRHKVVLRGCSDM